MTRQKSHYKKENHYKIIFLSRYDVFEQVRRIFTSNEEFLLLPLRPPSILFKYLLRKLSGATWIPARRRKYGHFFAVIAKKSMAKPKSQA